MSERQQYPLIEPFESGYLGVGDGHELYYEQCGNPNGKPALFVHGGPGAGGDVNARRFFDPAGAVFRDFHLVTPDLQQTAQSLPRVGVVLDDENAHGPRPAGPARGRRRGRNVGRALLSRGAAGTGSPGAPSVPRRWPVYPRSSRKARADCWT